MVADERLGLHVASWSCSCLSFVDAVRPFSMPAIMVIAISAVATAVVDFARTRFNDWRKKPAIAAAAAGQKTKL